MTTILGQPALEGLAILVWITANTAMGSFAGWAAVGGARDLRANRRLGGDRHLMVYPRGYVRGQALRAVGAAAFVIAGVLSIPVRLPAEMLPVSIAAAFGAVVIAVNSVSDFLVRRTLRHGPR
ncbi:MAG: hypothetical protein ACRDYA_08125 [Egibacteraceae bacterium]